MSFALDITHIGEALVAELLKNNDTVKKNFWEICQDKISMQNWVNAIPNADIENGDPKHQIDILLIGKEKAIAIEAKLGKSLKSPSSFYDAHLAKEFKFDEKKGSMIQFFSRCLDKIELKNRKNIKLADKWVLLVRTNKIMKALSENNFKIKKKYDNWEEMHRSCCIISLEQLLNGIDKEVFNETVKKCISSEDYLQSWDINPSAPSGVSGLSQEN